MGAPLRWYFDFLSPFSYLHWQKVKGLRATHAVEPESDGELVSD